MTVAGQPHSLATTMHTAWVRFATTRDAGWSRYEPGKRTTMVFDTSSEVVVDATGSERGKARAARDVM